MHDIKRLHYIDGIRGWAALVVLLFHLSHEVFGKIFPVYTNPILRVLLDGHLAVCIFFVLSGDALSTAFFSTGRYSILAKMAVKRYFRLAGPILLSTLLVYCLMQLDLTFNQAAAQITKDPSWLGSFINFEPNLIRALKFGLRFAFTDANSPGSYDNFLWPMGIELVGSFALFLYLAIYKNLKYPLGTLIFFTVLFTASRLYYGLFCIGMIFSYLRNIGFFEKVTKSNAYEKWLTVGGIAWLLMAFLAVYYEKKVIQVDVLLAGAFVFLIYCKPGCIQFFSNGLSKFLGKISFPLYITHFAVIISYTSFLIDWLNSKNMLDLKGSLLVIFSSAIIAILVAELFSSIEERYLRRLDKLASLAIKPEEVKL